MIRCVPFPYAMSILLLLGASLLSACNPALPAMAENTPVPSAVEVTRIEETNTTESEVNQKKAFNQCESLSPIKAQIIFGESSEQGVQEELVLAATAGGEVGVSPIAKISLQGSIEKHFASSEIKSQAHEEFVSIEVPAKSNQEYSINWKETRREGSIYYLENGVEKSSNYSYRIGLELASTNVKDLGCPSADTPTQTTMEQALLSETAAVNPAAATPIEPTPGPRITKFSACLQPCDGTNWTKVFPEGTQKIYAAWNYKNIPVGAHYVRSWAMDGREWVRYDCSWPGPSSGHNEVGLSEPDGLHSGNWVVTIMVNDEVLLSESLVVAGNWKYWHPVGTIYDCFGTVPNQP